MKLCPHGKRCYPSRKSAKQNTHGVSNRFRVYMCPACGYWHVTSDVVPFVKRDRRPRRDDAA